MSFIEKLIGTRNATQNDEVKLTDPRGKPCLDSTLLIQNQRGNTEELKGQITDLALGSCDFLSQNGNIPKEAINYVIRLGTILPHGANHEYPCRIISWGSNNQCRFEFTGLPENILTELAEIIRLSKEIKRKRFTIAFTVYLGDTNAEGNVYFSKFFDWQGMAREAFVRDLVPDILQTFLSGRMRLFTVDASIHFRNELKLYDEVEIRVTPLRPIKKKQVTIELDFIYRDKKTGKEIAVGKQKIAFVDNNGQLISIPQILLETGRPYLDDLEQIRWLYYLKHTQQ